MKSMKIEIDKTSNVTRDRAASRFCFCPLLPSLMLCLTCGCKKTYFMFFRRGHVGFDAPLACSSAVQKVRGPENEARGPFPQGFSCVILFGVQKETNFSLGLLFNRSSTRAASFNSNRGHANFPAVR